MRSDVPGRLLASLLADDKQLYRLPQTDTELRLQTMTTIPSRLARLTQSSPSWDVARSRSRSLYRMWYRSAPEICQLYALNMPPHAIRAKVREEFERNAHVDDIKAVDILLLKGYQEYQETLNCWKMDSHLMRYFSKEEVRHAESYPAFAVADSLPRSNSCRVRLPLERGSDPDRPLSRENSPH